MTTKTQTGHTIIASASQAAGATTRGRLDCSTGVDGGVITAAVINGATGPTVQCVIRLMVAHRGPSMPAAGPEGNGALDWKIVAEVGCGVVANARTRVTRSFGPEVAYWQIETTGNTGQPVTVEALGTTFDYA